MSQQKDAEQSSQTLMPQDGFQPASFVPTCWHTADGLEEVKPRSTLGKYYWCAEKTSLFVLIRWKAAAIQSTASVYIMNAGNWKMWKEQTPLCHAPEMQTPYRLVTNSGKTSCRSSGFSSYRPMFALGAVHMKYLVGSMTDFLRVVQFSYELSLHQSFTFIHLPSWR
jgi:hypothetical protein